MFRYLMISRLCNYTLISICQLLHQMWSWHRLSISVFINLITSVKVSFCCIDIDIHSIILLYIAYHISLDIALYDIFRITLCNSIWEHIALHTKIKLKDLKITINWCKLNNVQRHCILIIYSSKNILNKDRFYCLVSHPKYMRCTIRIDMIDFNIFSFFTSSILYLCLQTLGFWLVWNNSHQCLIFPWYLVLNP